MYIYLDNCATTPVHEGVLAAMLPWLQGLAGNPSSLHTPGQQARAALEEARAEAARLIGVAPVNLVFTAGGTESINLGIMGALRANRKAGRHLITSRIEHPAVVRTMDYLEGEGYEVTRLPADENAVILPALLEAALRDDTVLVSLMHVNNVTGTVQDLPVLAAMVKKRNALFHVDAVQSAGKIPVDPEAWGVDLLSFSAHKIHGPKGTGGLFIRRGLPFLPVLHGGGQEMGRRPGTENLAGIAGFAAACRLAREQLPDFARQVGDLRDVFEKSILERIPGCHIHARDVPRAPHISNISFPGADSEAMLVALDLLGVAVSAGSACSSGAMEPSPVLRAMRMPDDLLHSALRFSFSLQNETASVQEAVSLIAEAVKQIRAAGGR